MEPLLVLNNLSFSFDEKKKKLFDNFSCLFKTAGLYFIQGKNGAGKSTLFKILSGEHSDHKGLSGEIKYKDFVFDVTTQEYVEFAQQYIRSVPQNFDDMLAPQFNFYQNLQFTQIKEYPSLRPFKRIEKLPDIVVHSGIPTDTAVENLSGGQRQILAILMALQRPTKILLLDEPTAALDQENSHLVMKFLVELQKREDLMILFICHDHDLLSYSSVSPLIV